MCIHPWARVHDVLQDRLVDVELLGYLDSSSQIALQITSLKGSPNYIRIISYKSAPSPYHLAINGYYQYFQD